MPQTPSFKPQLQRSERVPQRPKAPQPSPEEKPTSPFEKRSYIKKEEVKRWATRSREGYEMLKEIWRGYTDKRDKILNEFFQKYWGEKKSYLSKKDYNRIKKQLEKEEKWASWPRKKEIQQMKKFLEKFEKNFPA